MSVETSPAAQKKLKSFEKRKAAERREDLRHIMSDLRGRRFMYRQIFIDGCLQDVYLTADSGIYRHEGKRGQAAELMDEVQRTFPDEYVLMITERLRDQGTEQVAQAEAKDTAADDEDAR